MLLGVADPKTVREGKYQRLKVKSAEIHEKYEYVEGKRGYYDIAVLELTTDIEWDSRKIQPICLPYKVWQYRFWSIKFNSRVRSFK